jgi:hypothetical protein
MSFFFPHHGISEALILWDVDIIGAVKIVWWSAGFNWRRGAVEVQRCSPGWGLQHCPQRSNRADYR